jgi:hypothetical protein
MSATYKCPRRFVLWGKRRTRAQRRYHNVLNKIDAILKMTPIEATVVLFSIHEEHQSSEATR